MARRRPKKKKPKKKIVRKVITAPFKGAWYAVKYPAKGVWASVKYPSIGLYKAGRFTGKKIVLPVGKAAGKHVIVPAAKFTGKEIITPAFRTVRELTGAAVKKVVKNPYVQAGAAGIFVIKYPGIAGKILLLPVNYPVEAIGAGLGVGTYWVLKDQNRRGKLLSAIKENPAIVWEAKGDVATIIVKGDRRTTAVPPAAERRTTTLSGGRVGKRFKLIKLVISQAKQRRAAAAGGRGP